MNKNDKIRSLFKKEFAEGEWLDKKNIVKKFICNCKKECKYDIKTTPSYSPFLGDANTNVMLIAEAPSSAEGIGVFYSGHFEKFFEEKKKEILKIY